MATMSVSVTDFPCVACFVKCVIGGIIRHFADLIPFMTSLECSQTDE